MLPSLDGCPCTDILVCYVEVGYCSGVIGEELYWLAEVAVISKSYGVTL